MAEQEYTPAEIERAIESALRQQKVEAIPGLIALLALQDPARAESVRQMILAGLRVAQSLDLKEK